MGNLEDLERRVTAVEERLDDEAGLRAGHDRDLSDISHQLRAQKGSIQALATTQSEHTRKLDQLATTMIRHGAILDHHTEMLSRHGEMLERHDQSLGSAHGKLDQIITMLDGLIDSDGR